MNNVEMLKAYEKAGQIAYEHDFKIIIGDEYINIFHESILIDQMNTVSELLAYLCGYDRGTKSISE